jgi:hypothetical protein
VLNRNALNRNTNSPLASFGKACRRYCPAPRGGIRAGSPSRMYSLDCGPRYSARTLSSRRDSGGLARPRNLMIEPSSRSARNPPNSRRIVNARDRSSSMLNRNVLNRNANSPLASFGKACWRRCPAPHGGIGAGSPSRVYSHHRGPRYSALRAALHLPHRSRQSAFHDADMCRPASRQTTRTKTLIVRMFKAQRCASLCITVHDCSWAKRSACPQLQMMITDRTAASQLSAAARLRQQFDDRVERFAQPRISSRVRERERVVDHV